MFNKYLPKEIAQVTSASAKPITIKRKSKKTAVTFFYKSMLALAASIILTASFAQTKSFQKNQQTQYYPQLLSPEKIQNQGILFLENKGQIMGPKGESMNDILFSAKGTGCKFFITKNGLSYQFDRIKKTKEFDDMQQLGRPDPAILAKIKTSTHRVNMRLSGANVNTIVRRENEKTYFENYYNVPEHPEGIRGVKAYDKITFEDIYPNIDWVIYGTDKSIKYNFIVHPGGDPSSIKMQYDFADKLKINSDGSVTFTTALGKVTDDAPHCFQGEAIVESKFILKGSTVSFSLANYNPSKELVIDPIIIWATYYGGTNYEHASSSAVDGSGNIYMTGYTQSTASIASGGFQNTFGGANDAFLVKFDDAGTRLWATYFGGTGSDFGQSAAVDVSGNVYMAGYTGTPSGIASGGFQNTFGGGSYDALLVKFDGAGSRTWATYYGGSGTDVGNAVAIDASGNVYLTGYTSSTGSIASGGFQNSFGGGYDAFQVKFNSAGSRLWGTYYGGSGYDFAQGSAIDGSGNVFMTGYTKSITGIASAGGFQNSFGGIYDAFLVKLNSAGSRTWATYYGGAGNDVGNSAVVDGSGNVYASGYTTSTNNIASGGFQNTSGGSNDAFLAKFDAGGSRLWATYYGGSGNDYVQGTCIDALGNICLAGYTNSTGLASGGFQNSLGGSNDAFFVKLNVLGSRIWSSYYGGTGLDVGSSITISGTANLYMAGYTQSTTSIASGGFQNTLGGVDDAFLVKISDPAICTLPAFTAPVITQPTCTVPSGSIVVNATGTGTLEFSINNGSSWQVSGTFNNLVSGNYNVVARLQSSPVCVSVYSSNPVVIGIAPTAPVIMAPVITQPTCAVPSGAIVVNATGSGTLEFTVNNGGSWQTSNTFSSLTSGNYITAVRLQSSPTCVTNYSSNPVIINGVPAAPVLAAPALTHPTCVVPSGSIVVNATGSGSLEFSVNNGDTWDVSNTFNSLVPGSYNAAARLQNNPTCIANYNSNPIVINSVPTAPAVTTPVITQPNCSVQTGTIVANATGSGILEFSIDNGSNWQVSNIFSSLVPDNYNVFVRLQSNPTCTTAYPDNPVVINTVPQLPIVTVPDIIQPDCITSSGTIAVNATGSDVLEFSVDNGGNWQLSNLFNGLIPGSYNIVVRLQSSPECAKNYKGNPVVINTAPTVNPPNVIQPTCSVQTGTIVINTIGNDLLEYSTNNGSSWQASNNFSGLVPGSYNIVIRLQNSPSCTTNYSGNPVVINAIPAIPSVTSPLLTQPTCSVPSGSIVVNATGTGTLEFSINNGSSWQESNIFGSLAPSNYNVAVRLQNNPTCIATYSGNPVVITAIPTTPVITTPTVTQPTCSIQSGTIIVNASGSGTLEFSTSNGGSWQSSNTFSGLASGSYNIAVRLQSSPACAAGYSNNPVVINQVPVPPSATISGTTGVCLNSTSPKITFTGSNGTPPYTFTYTLNGISQTPITTITGNSVMLNAPTNTVGSFTYALVSVSNGSCSSSAIGTATVTVGSTTPPARPGKITGTSTNLCGGGIFTYSVPAVSGTLIYNWTVPAGFTVSGGQGTRNVNITVPSNFLANNINVTASNGCTVSSVRSLAVNAVVPNPGASITGAVTVVANQTNVVYKLPSAAGLTYTWSVPPGASIVTGQGTFRITVNFGITSGFIRVTVSNACGSSPTGKLQVAVSLLSNVSSSSEKIVTPKASLEAYPNPVSSLVTVKFNAQQPEKKYDVIVTEVTGKTILRKSGKTNSGENSLQLDMRQYANGMYILKVLTGNQVRTIKLYKEK